MDCRSPEEALIHAIIEARRAAPAILYLPHLTLWWDTAPASLRATLWMLLADLPSDLPLLLFATADEPLAEQHIEAAALFESSGSSVIDELEQPIESERAAMFDGLIAQVFHPAKQKPTRLAKLPAPQVCSRYAVIKNKS